ncbi:Uncharacterised protein [Chlamydia abortus]|nr:hypothetical protein CP01DC11_1247 [Chlamydia psittaci 01DC11]SGA31295.1 Uncharacterised protein [Chlamydia abortus]
MSIEAEKSLAVLIIFCSFILASIKNLLFLLSDLPTEKETNNFFLALVIAT